MGEFTPIGNKLGQGGIRVVEEVELSNSNGDVEHYAMAIQRSRTKEDFINSTEYKITQKLSDLATAIDYLGALGAVSQDIKLSNILIDGEGVWLSDFNISEFYDDNTIDRRSYFHLTQILLVGRLIDKYFIENKVLCSRNDFIEGLKSLDGKGVLDGTPDKSGVIRSMMEHNFPEVQNLIDRYWQDRFLPLVDFVSELKEIIIPKINKL